MGIRIHKVLGYGLTDVQTGSSHDITDPRINVESPALTYEAPPIEEYIAWLEREATRRKNIETDLELALLRDMKADDARLPHLDDAVVHNGEFGLGNVLVISPPAYRDWRRFDDTIDWIEESYPVRELDPQSNHARTLRHGIYPFVGYMDARTGEKLDDRVFAWVRATNGNRPVSPDVLDELAQEAGFDDNGDAWANVAPIVPNDVRNLATFFDLFTDDETWKLLRPVLYTYWS